jgi:Uma2 family endonuclease
MVTAARLQMTPQQYLATSYSPDCDFIDGELQKRNLGELEHSAMQTAIIVWFMQRAEEWRITPLPEIRVQTSPGNFRIADIAVKAENAPRERVLVTPPLIVIEILSPEDRVSRYKERLEDYRRMGVPNIWVIDPMTLDGFDCSSGNWNKTDTFRIHGSEIFMAIHELTIKR